MGNTKLRITKGIISRSLYAGHIALATYLVYRETQNLHYLAFIASIVLLIIEGIVTLYYKKGKELGWYVTCIWIDLTKGLLQ